MYLLENAFTELPISTVNANNTENNDEINALDHDFEMSGK